MTYCIINLETLNDGVVAVYYEFIEYYKGVTENQILLSRFK